jgi:hypothetical protein
MSHYSYPSFIPILILILTVGVAPLPVLAVAPTLSLANTSGDVVQITVQGDPNAGVALSYNLGSPSGALTTSLGKTNANGTFSGTISSSAYAVNPGSQVYVTVNGQQSPQQTWPYGSSSGSATAAATSAAMQVTGITFSISNPTIIAGQSVGVVVSGGSGNYFVSNNPSPNIAETAIAGNTLTLRGKGAGSSFVTVCATSGGCNTIFFTGVNAPAGTVAPAAAVAPTVPATTATTAAPIPTQPAQIAAAAVSNSEVLAEIRTMQNRLAQILSEIQAMQNTLLQLAAKLAANTPVPSAATPAAPSASKHQFLVSLYVGSEGADVIALQERLTAEGFYSGAVTGYYGSFTKGAVMRYQTARGLTPSGVLDVSTRTMLNAGL